jgi:hypothetical protein
MTKTKPALPETTKLTYTAVEGVPTILIEAALTTRAQVQALIDQLEKLSGVLPEAKARRVKSKAKTTARTKTNSKEEELFGKAHD